MSAYATAPHPLAGRGALLKGLEPSKPPSAFPLHVTRAQFDACVSSLAAATLKEWAACEYRASVRDGVRAEALFMLGAGLAGARYYAFDASTSKAINIGWHIDCVAHIDDPASFAAAVGSPGYVRLGDGGASEADAPQPAPLIIGVDVKALKRASRGDAAVNTDMLWVELDAGGWLYGGREDVVAVETEEAYLLLRRDLLAEHARERVDTTAVVHSSQEALYKLYMRESPKRPAQAISMLSLDAAWAAAGCGTVRKPPFVDAKAEPRADCGAPCEVPRATEAETLV